MTKLLTKKRIKYTVDGALVIIGTFLMGFAFNVFLNNNRISPSGFSGLSAIISNVINQHFGTLIPASVFYLFINSVLFILSYKTLGLRFAINSAIGIISYSIFMEVCNFNIGLSGSDLLLCAIYGGVIMGIGLGFVFRGHGSTGGSDMLANLLKRKFKFLTVGTIVFIVDFVVVALSFIAYNDLNLALYSLISIYIMTKMSDVIISGVQSLRAYYIISNNSEELAQKIMQEVPRGVTRFSSEGMYTHNQQKVLLTVVTRAEAVKLRQIVADYDRSAFMFSCTVSEAMGRGFLPLNNSKLQKQKAENFSENVDKIENQKTKKAISKTNQTKTKRTITKKTTKNK